MPNRWLMQSLSALKQKDVVTPEYQMMWHLNQLCNFRCEYCQRAKVDKYRLREHPECGRHSPEFISHCFDSTGKTWRIHLSGGEPFLYPKFVELARALTKNNYLSINTNFSTPNIYKFGDIILPEKVHSINANIHTLEREKRKNGVAEYIEKSLYLQDRGFNIRLMYITHPLLFPRLLKDMEYFKTLGLKNFYIKVFRGRWKGKLYPKAYTKDQRILIKNYAISRYEIDILHGKVRFFNRLCTAGQKSFRMDVSGNLTRCNTLNKKYGNLFIGKYCFDESALPCPVITCWCPYQGMKFAQKQNGILFVTVKETLKEYTKMIMQKVIL